MSADEPRVLVRVDDLERLFDAAQKADAAGLLGKCEAEPCPDCSAFEQVQQQLAIRRGVMTDHPRARHRLTEIKYEVLEGFGPGQNGFSVLAWINDNGGDARVDQDGLLYIKNKRRARTRNWLKPGDRVAQRLTWPDMKPTDDFYRLEPDVWDDAYDDLGVS